MLLDTTRGKGGGRSAEVADAVRFLRGAEHLWTARERAELRRQEENDAKYPVNTCGAASATRRTTRPAQLSKRPDPSREALEEETAMESDDARLFLEFGAVYAWTSRDRVIIEQMVTYLDRTSRTSSLKAEGDAFATDCNVAWPSMWL